MGGMIHKKENVGIQVAVSSCHKTTVVKRVRNKKRQLGASSTAFFKSPIVVSC